MLIMVTRIRMMRLRFGDGEEDSDNYHIDGYDEDK